MITSSSEELMNLANVSFNPTEILSRVTLVCFSSIVSLLTKNFSEALMAQIDIEDAAEIPWIFCFSKSVKLSPFFSASFFIPSSVSLIVFMIAIQIPRMIQVTNQTKPVWQHRRTGSIPIFYQLISDGSGALWNSQSAELSKKHEQKVL